MAAAALLRLLPHPLNMTPIGALALFSGAHLHSRWAYVLPLVALIIGDVLLGWFDLTVMLGVYIGFSLTTLVGRHCLRQRQSSPRYVVARGCWRFGFLSNFQHWHVAQLLAEDLGWPSCLLHRRLTISCSDVDRRWHLCRSDVRRIRVARKKTERDPT